MLINEPPNEIEMTEAEEVLTQENERMRNALQKISDWQRAYPIDIFPEPDFKRANEVLNVAGFTLDAISASNMRYVLNGIKEIVDTGLESNAELTRAHDELK